MPHRLLHELFFDASLSYLTPQFYHSPLSSILLLPSYSAQRPAIHNMFLKCEWTDLMASMTKIFQKRKREEVLDHSKPATEPRIGPNLQTLAQISHSLPASTMGLISRSGLIQANDVSSDPPLEESELALSTYIRPAQTSPNDSWSHQAIPPTTVVLSIMSPVVGAVPVVGSPVKAAIDGLLVVLNAIDVSDRLIANLLGLWADALRGKNSSPSFFFWLE